MGSTAKQILSTDTHILLTAMQLVTTAIHLLNCTGSTAM